MLLPTRQAIEKARDPAADPWSTGDAILYGLCEDNLEHRKPGRVIAKVWLIGRAYAATVERGPSTAAGGSSTTTEFYEKVARHLIDSDLDARLAEVRGGSMSDIAEVKGALELHAYLIGVLLALKSRKKRSFASKYLHFHAPSLFPIYDSLAERRVRKILAGSGTRAHLGLAGVGDEMYRRFAARVLQLRDRIHDEHDVRLSFREIDRLLWGRIE